MHASSTREIAIVDDDRAVLDSYQFMLELAGHTVAVYPSAMAFLASTGPRPRCLILDHNMPAMTGLELAARLRSAGDGIPIVLVTSFPSAAIIARAAELGVHRVIEKPPPDEELLRFVAECLGDDT
jgi:FixJ family two-component response regulator